MSGEPGCAICGVPFSEHPDTDACAIRDEAPRLDEERLADALHRKVCGPFATVDPQECVYGRQRDLLLAVAVAREYTSMTPAYQGGKE